MSKDLTELMRKITGKTGWELDTSYLPKALPPAKIPPPLPPTHGKSLPTYASGGGSAEMVETRRELYDERNVFSSDGIFSVAFSPIKKIYFDNGGFIEFVDPFPPPKEEEK
jgi:hypothetical protein